MKMPDKIKPMHKLIHEMHYYIQELNAGIH